MKLVDIINGLNKNPIIAVYIILGILPFISLLVQTSNSSFIFEWLYLSIGLYSLYNILTKRLSTRHLVPIFLILSLSVIYFNIQSNGWIFWTYPYAFAIIFSALWVADILSVEWAFLLAVIFVAASIHMVPAFLTDYLEEIDPYYHYKWAESLFNNGNLPDHDWLTYPKLGGLDRSDMPLANSVTIASFGYILTFFGYGVHDAAMMLSVIAAIVTLIVAYFVVKEAYYKHPNAKYAAMLVVFILMMQIGWSTKAHATDCEDDALGACAFLASMLLYLMSINRDDIRLSIIGGVVFGWLITLYDAQRLLMMLVFITITVFSVIGIIQNRRSFKYYKHFIIIWIIGEFIARIILHSYGFGFGLFMPQGIEIVSLIMASISVLANEAYIKYKVVRLDHLFVLAIVSVLIAGPYMFDKFYSVAVTQNRQSNVVFKTIAEQAPFASSVNGYISSISGIYGVFGLVSAVCIIPLLYLGCKRFNFNYMVFGVWGSVLLWGLYFKSQYVFISSLPFALIGSFAVLYIAMNKEELNTLAIIPTIVLIAISVVYTPLGSLVFTYNPTAIFFNVADYDRIGWEPALQFFKNQSANTAVATWWDYGHWLTAVSHKFVLIDNLQRDHMEIQEVAKFFMKETDEDKAMNILRGFQNVYDNEPYKSKFGGVDLKYIAIDWTMIGKSGAMRFIATGDIKNNTDGDYSSYAMCTFMPQYSNINSTLVTNADGSFDKSNVLVFGCTMNQDSLGGIIFDLRSNSADVYAVDYSGNKYKWDLWMKSHNSSLFGVEDPKEILAVCTKYYGQTDKITPTFTTFIYGSKDFKDLMLARLYFGDYIESYKSLGLSSVTWGESKYFKHVQTFENGFVNVWEIDYNRVNNVDDSNGKIYGVGQ